MRAQWVCSREQRIALYKWSSIKINQSHARTKFLLCVSNASHEPAYICVCRTGPTSGSQWSGPLQSPWHNRTSSRCKTPVYLPWASSVGYDFVSNVACFSFICSFVVLLNWRQNRWSRLRLGAWWFVAPQEGCRILRGDWHPCRMWHSSLRSADHRVWAWVILCCSLDITRCLKWASLA